MKFRFPLWLKVSVWAILNLVLLAIVGLVFFFGQMGPQWASLISEAAINHVRAISNVIELDLQRNPTRDRDELLANVGDIYGVEFLLVGLDGSHIAGSDIKLPAEVLDRMKVLTAPLPRGGRGGAQFGGRGGPPGFGGRGGRGPDQGGRGGGPAPGTQPSASGGTPEQPAQPGQPAPSQPTPVPNFGGFRGGGQGGPGGPPTDGFLQRTVEPTRYWIGRRFVLPTGAERPIQSVLIAVTDSLGSAGLFFDFRPFAYAAIGVAVLSILFWLPMVQGVTRSIGRLTRATEKIAEGRFETRVAVNRADEIGRLGEAVNRMAGRLDTLVNGQKRFLGDIAHELGSPIARMQFATSVLEEKADPSLKGSISDVREEVQNMSELVNELLAFTRAGLKAREAVITDVELMPLVTRALDREDAGTKVTAKIPEGLKVRCDEGMLARAIHNLVRNALRYAASDGPVSVEAQKVGNQVTLTVSDVGPGVPPEALSRLGEPFFRPETARTRDTGGVGLGLAIVKGAVKAFGGTIVFSNRTPRGFSAEITLEAASS